MIIACAVVSSIAFVVAAILVSRHPAGIDRGVEDALASRSFPSLLVVPMQVLAFASSARATFSVCLVVGLYFALRWSDWRPGLLLMVAFIGTVVQVDVLKSLFDRADPADWATGDLTGSAFPSGHVALAVAVFGTMAVLAAIRLSVRPRVVIAAGAIGLIAGSALSRLVLGAHWVTDVIGGLGIGGLWLAFVSAVALSMKPIPRHRAEASG